MMEEFEVFLLSKELFWPLGKRSFDKIPFPQLSIGVLLLTLNELKAQQSAMEVDQDRHYQKLLTEYERFADRKRVAIEHKAVRELVTRTNLWRAYLQDLNDDPFAVEEYANQVRNRVLMTLLHTLSIRFEGESEITGFQELDQRVLLTAISVEFIWDEKLKPIYPIEEFPFLYVKPR
jgi:hypothetical protein